MGMQPWALSLPDKELCLREAQRVFPTQGVNPGLLPCRQILHRLHLGWGGGTDHMALWAAIASQETVPTKEKTDDTKWPVPLESLSVLSLLRGTGVRRAERQGLQPTFPRGEGEGD